MKLSKRSSLTDVAFAVGDALHRHGLDAVLTGGACAGLYAGGPSVSNDADFVLSGRVTQANLDAAMASVGFIRRGDHYARPGLRFYVEFPRGPLAIGRDFKLQPVLKRRGNTRTLALTPTDSCRDRLAAFYHWNDRQSLALAVKIALRNRVRVATIRKWSLLEGAADGYEEFRVRLRAARERVR